MDHIYAAGRWKHKTHPKANSLWLSDYSKWYWDLIEQYQSQIIIEIGGHDHWEDLRIFDRDTKGPLRNLLVAVGVSPDHKQLPGFNTFEIDSDLMPKSLVMTSLDITKAYGSSTIPPLSSLPTYHIDFSSDFGLKDLTIKSIKTMLDGLSGNLSSLKEYMVNKVGYPVSKLKDGLKLYEDWGLIDSSDIDASYFLCQALRAKDGDKLSNCGSKGFSLMALPAVVVRPVNQALVMI